MQAAGITSGTRGATAAAANGGSLFGALAAPTSLSKEKKFTKSPSKKRKRPMAR